MRAGLKDFMCVLSSVFYLMAAMSAVSAAQSGSRIMYVQTAICGIMGAALVIAVLVRL